MPEQSYPTMRYAPGQTPVMCSDADELKALGPEWRDVPYSDEEVSAWQAEQAASKEEDVPPPPRSRR